MFHPARFRKILRELLVSRRDLAAFFIVNDGAAAGRPLIDGEDIFQLYSPVQPVHDIGEDFFSAQVDREGMEHIRIFDELFVA